MADQNNPWGNKGKQPPDLNELVDKGMNRISKIFKGGGGPGGKKGSQGSGKGLWLLILGGIILYTLIKTVYTVNTGEKAVVLKFGKYKSTESAGLHFIIPFIETKYIVNVQKVQEQQFGFRGQNTRLGSRNLESPMLTWDQNVINLNWVVQYQINNPKDYLFQIEEVTETIRDVSESVIRRLVGNRGFDYILNQREEIASLTLEEMQELLDKYSSGIRLLKVQMKDVNPPDKVRASFNEVNEAEQEKSKLVNEAEKDRNERVPKARGDAERVIEEAKGYASKRINTAEGDVARFKAIYTEYKNFQAVTRQRMYIEVMKNVLPKVKEVYILDQKNSTNMNFLNLNK